MKLSLMNFMIKKYCNIKATAMKILVKSNQHNYDNCELLDCRVVGLGGLEPPTSPLSGVRSNQAELQTQSCLHELTKYKSSEQGL